MKSTKKALLLSMMSMLLCVAILMGTTFAWFTDSVTSGVNTITAGNLDIELEYSKTGADGSWKTVEGKTDLFSDVTLWEPGATSVVYLKLTNKGTLALKYNLAVTATGGDFTNAAGQSKNLKDALKFAQVAGPNPTTYATRDLAVAATTSVALGLSDYAQANHMAASDVSYITLVVTMPTTVGNEFNYKTGTTAPEIQLNITLNATQYSAESDSFDKYYDVTAEPIDVYTAEEFTKAVAQAKTGDTINVMKAGLDLTVEYTDTKTLTLRGEKITKLTVNIPGGTVHVYNEVTEVEGENVDLQHSAHFYNKITTLNATAGHFVVEAGATVDNIVAKPVLTTDNESVKETAKELIIEVKGAATTVTTPVAEPVKDVEIKVAGTVEEVEVPKADTKIAVKVAESATVTELKVTDTAEDAKIVLQNDGTVGNEADVAEKTQAIAEMNTDAKTLTINNADELKAFAKGANASKYNGYTATLGADIDLENVEWTQINGAGKNITFNGDGKTIKNLKISDGHNAGFFSTGSGCTIKNLTVDGATVTGIGRIAVICGHGMCVTVDNCTVKNATVTADPTILCEDCISGDHPKGEYNGDKAGAIVGYLSGEPNAKVINCTVENCTVKGYRDIGALVGYANGTATVTGNTVKDSKIINDRTNNYNNYTEDAQFDANQVVGEKVDAATVENNTANNVTVSAIAPIVVPKDATPEQIQTAVDTAVAGANDGDTVVLPSSSETITLPSIPANITIKGDGNTKVVLANDVYGASAAAITEGATLENIVLDCGDSLYHGFQHSGPIEFKDCKINGKLTLYGPTVFTNCTINTTTAAGADYIWTYGCDVTFDGCTFNTLGKALLCYNEANGSGYNNVTVKNCTFNATAGAKAGAIANQNCAAIEIDNYGCGVNLTLSNNTVQTGDNAFSGEWRIKSYYPESANDKIIVNGVEYTSIALDGKTMTIDGSKNVTVND